MRRRFKWRRRTVLTVLWECRSVRFKRRQARLRRQRHRLEVYGQRIWIDWARSVMRAA